MAMYLQNLSLLSFKNYDEVHLEFCPKLNAFVGNNGVGKTNLLDAIYYLSFCKSFFNQVETQNIRFGDEQFIIQGNYVHNENTLSIYCNQRKQQKKLFKLNQKEYQRLADHIGTIPLVIIAPDDYILVVGGSEDRRKFMDGVISQFDKVYLDDLINYNRALLQRNTLLKQFSENKNFDYTAIELWDEQLIALGQKIYAKRTLFIEKYLPLFKEKYQFISNSNEIAHINYTSQLQQNNLRDLLKESIEKDKILKYTSAGIHKDDLDFIINDVLVRKFGSQGQQKSFLIALKIAEFEYIKDAVNITPILLLDDIFDKLDHLRVKQIIQMVAHTNFGQVFVTDTHAERIEAVFNEANTEHYLFHVHNNKVEPRK